jgi:hypothetical protein
VGILIGAVALVLLPARFGLSAYLIPIAVITSSYTLFQTANNTGAMANVGPDQRGVLSGLLNLPQPETHHWLCPPPQRIRPS